MNDENTNDTPTAAGSSRKRTAVVAAGVGVAGLLAGGLAAGAISAASADTGSAGYGDTGSSGSAETGSGSHGTAPGYGGRMHENPNADPSRPMRSDEKLLTGTTKTKVLAVVRAKYPNATVQRAETDSDGVYEAHIVNNGAPLIVQVGKDFKITGTQTGGGGHGPADHDGDGPGGSSAGDSGFRQS